MRAWWVGVLQTLRCNVCRPRGGLLRADSTIFMFLVGGICDSYRQRIFLAGFGRSVSFGFAVLSFAR